MQSVHEKYLNFEVNAKPMTLFIADKAKIPFGIEVEASTFSSFRSIASGTPVRLQKDGLTFGTCLQVRGLKNAHRFSCHFHFHALSLQRLEFVLSTLQNFFWHTSQNSMLYDLSPSGAQHKMGKEIHLGIMYLERGFLLDDRAYFVEGIHKLLGLGMGSTPAGDDFLLGFYAGLNFARNAETLIWKKVLEECICKEAPRRTTFLSNAYLEYGLRHAYHTYVMHLLQTIVRDDLEKDVLEQRIECLASAGHSSGKDFLVGLYRGLMIVKRKESSNENL